MNKTEENLSYNWYDCPKIGFNKDSFHRFLIWAVNDIGANDIFIESNEPLGIKKDNVTYNVTNRIIAYHEVAALIKEIYQASAQTELRSGRPFGFAYSFTYGKDEKLRFRVDASAGNSTTAIDEGIELVLRPTQGEPPSVFELDLNQRIIDTTKNKDGLVIVTGPTGSGKTTMIGSLLKFIIQTMRKHVISVEDPIEFDLKQVPNRLSRVFQSEIITNVISFTVYIKHMLRRSPDVVLLGELRDAESIDAGILTAQTGHLVYATGHTNNSSNTLERLVDDLPSDQQKSKLLKLVGSTRSIIHQRLLNARNGGRVAVIEELHINSELQIKMYSIVVSGNESLTNFLAAHIEEQGLSIKCSIKEKFSQGLLRLDTCIDELSQELNSNDILFFSAQCKKLFNDGKINETEFNQWNRYLEVFSERL
ncbi:Flp pilus assembly complex ATPase component TadA [Pseudoalteromonas nigrifaciens]|uniref:type IV pilus twitching motility protein PilT n=1 Tax=Pseudoalteromonas nigrifaciens TaxID=28109 RepID=UPI00178780FF|nr:ATPase, T2SS/T4P/T4SS family [Pseudoalteromonas nigrifaciens]MBE0420506.1 Flp pilus assembly complex ATPase component TadA [Pseudoalteromonas nigrifaciens]